MPFSINNSIFVCLWNCVCVEIWWKFSTSENLEFLVELNNFQTNRKNLKSFFSLMAIPLSLYVWGSLKTYPWFRIVDYSHFHNVIFGSFWYPRDQWETKAYFPDTDCLSPPVSISKYKQCFCHMWSCIQRNTEKNTLISCESSILRQWTCHIWPFR